MGTIPMIDFDYLDYIDKDEKTGLEASGFSNPIKYPNIRYWNLDDGDKDIFTLTSEGSKE